MLKRLELSDPMSCLNRAEPDEPVFVLRAKDPMAPMTLRHWATMAVGTHEEKKILSALKLAGDMEKYRAAHYPPLPGVAIAAAA